MSHGHSHDVETDTPRGKQQDRALKIVAGIQGVMFFVEAISGYFAHSASMIADSVDMLEDSLGAAASAVVRRRGPRAQAGVAIAKATIMAALGLGVLGGAVYTLFNPAVLPVTLTMAIVGGISLSANALCGGLLFRFRKDNLNMMAAWKCLRNDMISNVGVLLAAGLGHIFTSAIPDLVIGAAVATLCVKSAIGIFREAIPVFRAHKKAPPEKAKKPAKGPGLVPRMASKFKNSLRSVFGKVAGQQQPPVPAQQPVIDRLGQPQEPAKGVFNIEAAKAARPVPPAATPVPARTPPAP